MCALINNLLKMKTYILKSLVVLAVIVTAAAGCKDRNAEKRIAALENEIRELKGSKAADQVSNPEPGVVSQPVENTKPEGPLAALAFSKLDHDFGTIKEGDVVEHTFAFKNTGEAPLIIQSAQPSCGCTVPDWTKTPVPPGGSGFVKAKFDSSNKPGMQNKTITVVANTWPQQTVLRFKSMVTPKPQQSDAGPFRQ
jgi:hypothetical protein